MTKQAKLEEKIQNCYSEEDIIENFIYFTNPSRGKHCKQSTIRTAYRNKTFCSLWKKMDPTSYNIELNEV